MVRDGAIDRLLSNDPMNLNLFMNLHIKIALKYKKKIACSD